ncbi:MAG: DUF485 domain-containing protein [Anaerovibrio sp.]|nr:DUF485 domain-containing protein [Anaerovibrio sp.]
MRNPAVNWHEAFLSDNFQKAKGNRLHFVVPMLAVFTAAFLGLFTMQSFLRDIGQIPVFGSVDLGFLVVMSLFPLTGILGIAFTRYTAQKVYPFESALVREYGGVVEEEEEKDCDSQVELIHSGGSYA